MASWSPIKTTLWVERSKVKVTWFSNALLVWAYMSIVTRYVRLPFVRRIAGAASVSGNGVNYNFTINSVSFHIRHIRPILFDLY